MVKNLPDRLVTLLILKISQNGFLLTECDMGARPVDTLPAWLVQILLKNGLKTSKGTGFLITK